MRKIPKKVFSVEQRCSCGLPLLILFSIAGQMEQKQRNGERRERLVSRKRATANKQNGKTAASLKSTKINKKRPGLTHLKKCQIEKCNIRIEKTTNFTEKL